MLIKMMEPFSVSRTKLVEERLLIIYTSSE